MINFGDVPAGSVLPVMFSTYGKTNGESITLTGLAVTDIEIYKDTSVTQRSSDAGYALIDTDGIDIDGITGIHGFSIDTGDNTDSGFFAVGSFFTVVVSAVTIDSQTVNFIAATFRLTAAEGTAGYPAVDAQRISNSATAADNAEVVFATDFATNYSTANDKWQVEANVLQIEGSDATNQIRDSIVDDATRIDASALNTLSGHDPGETIMGATDLGTGSGFTAIPWNASWDAEVQSEVDDALVAQNLDHLVKIAVDTNFATTVHADSVIGQIADNGAGFDRTTDSLEAIRDNIGTAGAGLTAIDLPDQTMNITGNLTGNVSGSVGSVSGAVGSVTGNVGGNVTGTIGGLTAAALKDFFDTDSTTSYGSAVAGSVVKEIADNAGGSAPSAADIADAVWEEAIADHSGTAGSTAEQLAAAGAAGDPWATALPGAYGAGTAGKIVGDNINATVGSRATQTSVDDLPTNAELATALGTADDAVLAQIALVKAKTDSLTFTVAGQVDSNIQSVNDIEVTGNGQTGTEWGPA